MNSTMNSRVTAFRAFESAHRCNKGTAATHLSLKGGMLTVPDERKHQFLFSMASLLDVSRYASQPGDKQNPVHYTEVLTDVFAFFLDFDILTAPDSDPVTDELKMQWYKTLQNSFMAPLQPHNDELVSPECIVKSTDLAPFRDELDATACIALTAPDRKVTKDGVEYIKSGIHLIWANVLVTRETAKLLRTLAVTALREYHSNRDWEQIVDVSVYKPVSSLRMIGNYKAKVCSDCKTEEAKQLFATEAAGRKKVQALLKLSADMTSKKVFDFCYERIKYLLRSGASPDDTEIKILTQYRAACAALPTCPCRGKYKLTDLEAGCYTTSCVLDAHGERMQDLEEALSNDIFMQLYMCSVQRLGNPEETELKIPAHCPPVTEVEWSTSPSSSDPENQVEKFRGIRVKLKPQELKRKQTLENTKLMGMVQKYIRNNMGVEYAGIQVQSLYRLYGGGKKTDYNLDGTPPFSVVATVLGLGSKFCNSAGRDHSNNVIYFMFTADQCCLQMCRSFKNAGCKKVCKRVSKVSYQIYTQFFPFSKLSVSVLPEEAASWAAGTMSKEHLERNKVRKRLQRTEQSYKVFVGLTRKLDALTHAKLDAEDKKRQLEAKQNEEKAEPSAKRFKVTDAMDALDRMQESAAVFFDDDENNDMEL